MQVLGIAGSLRAGSYNRGLLRAAAALMPPDSTLEIAEIGEIPLYNQDVERAAVPPGVRSLRERVRAVDGLLFATPEYNFSLPGVLKNAIDWLSRPPEASALDDKPVAIVSASAGGFGGVRAQIAFRQICMFTNMHALNDPLLAVSHAYEKFDANGDLTDEGVRADLAEVCHALVAWIHRLKE